MLSAVLLGLLALGATLAIVGGTWLMNRPWHHRGWLLDGDNRVLAGFFLLFWATLTVLLYMISIV